MKNWIVFITVLLVSFKGFSCGYYPYGEDIRFSLLNPKIFSPSGFEPFYYSFDVYSNLQLAEEDKIELDENIQLWYEFFDKKYSKQNLYETIYNASIKSLKKSKSTNLLIKDLNQKENKSILDYLIFAKKCSPLNTGFSDPWERNEKFSKFHRTRALKKAIKKATQEQNLDLKKRYAYLAVRLAYYNEDAKKVKELFEQYFNKKENRDAIDFWALHFKIQFDKSSHQRNIDIATVFANSSEKRFSIRFFYDYELNLEETIKFAKNKEEVANLYLINSVRKVDYALENIKSFEKVSDNQNQLDFLVLREINKMEDWILTQYYSLFEPSLTFNWYGEAKLDSMNVRIKKDQQYALKFVKWMETIDSKSESWNTLKNYVYFLSGESSSILNSISNEMPKLKNDDILQFNKYLWAIVKVKSSPNLTDKKLQEIMLDKNHYSNQFLFALARELEYKGNTLDAAYLLSHVNEMNDWVVSWKSNKLVTNLWSDYFYEWFFYLDAQYTELELEEIIKDLKSPINTEFDKWKKEKISAEISRVYDLLGTKYLRKNDLNKALSNYELVNDSLWGSEDAPYSFYLKANPFYTNMYNEHQPVAEDTISYTKPDMIRKLLSLLNQSKIANGDKKASYEFQIANCYLNMTQYGNSWLMKRYYWTSNATNTGLIDDEDYFQCKTAKSYYLKAYLSAKDEHIKALAIRMAGRCEKYRLIDIHKEDYSYLEEEELFESNSYYKKLKDEFPDHYEPLISNCESFGEYYGYLKIR